MEQFQDGNQPGPVRGNYELANRRNLRQPSSGGLRPTDELETSSTPPPGMQALALAGVLIGLLLLGVQLWLLTVALDLFLAGSPAPSWILPLISGLIFIGGLLVVWLLKKQQRLRR